MTPETFWIHLRENVIGVDVLREGTEARQAATYRAIAQWLLQHSVIDILDIGCNVAALARFLAGMDYAGRYFGIDSNPYAVALARQHAYAMEGNLRQVGFQDRWFEAVVVKDVIEHLETIDPLREAFRVAARYVILAVYLPFIDTPSQIKQHEDGYYINTYNRQDVITLAGECGFILAQTVYTQESDGTPNAVYVWERI